MKNFITFTITAFFSLNIMAVNATEDPTKTAEQIAEEERCTVPAFAKAIGHDELWKKHNGCPTKEDNKKDE